MDAETNVETVCAGLYKINLFVIARSNSKEVTLVAFRFHFGGNIIDSFSIYWVNAITHALNFITLLFLERTIRVAF